MLGGLLRHRHHRLFCIDVSSEHTPINLPRKSSFQLESDATIATLPRHSGALSSSRHTAASTVPTLLKLGSFGTGPKKLVADYDSVANSFSSTRKLVADADHETLVSVEELVSSETRDRD